MACAVICGWGMYSVHDRALSERGFSSARRTVYRVANQFCLHSLKQYFGRSSNISALKIKFKLDKGYDFQHLQILIFYCAYYTFILKYR